MTDGLHWLQGADGSYLVAIKRTCTIEQSSRKRHRTALIIIHKRYPKTGSAKCISVYKSVQECARVYKSVQECARPF